jgi:hypothetical protein
LAEAAVDAEDAVGAEDLEVVRFGTSIQRNRMEAFFIRVGTQR